MALSGLPMPVSVSDNNGESVSIMHRTVWGRRSTDGGFYVDVKLAEMAPWEGGGLLSSLHGEC